MVHPTNLFRSDSEGGQRFSAPVGNYFRDIDCGITALPCLTKLLRLQKLAKLSVFITVLSLLGLMHGIVKTYFKGTSHLWFSHYNFPSFVEDWFVYLTEIFVGILALCISYWGNRMHRTTWIGALTMLIAVSGGTLAIPEIYNPFTNIEIKNAITGPALCSNENEERYTKDLLGSEGFNEVTFGYFFIFQIMFSMVTISFITHGLSYVDDHISAKHGPALLGLILAAQEAGKQFGIYFSWVPYISKMFSIFSSPGIFVAYISLNSTLILSYVTVASKHLIFQNSFWKRQYWHLFVTNIIFINWDQGSINISNWIRGLWILLILITFCVGVAIAMFPKVLPHLAIQKSVNSLVSIASGGLPFDDDETEHGFCKVLCSLLKNKVLLLNIMSFVLMHSALINFSLIEKYFNQSKYHVPIEENDSTRYSDPDIIQFTTNLLKQPLVAVCLVTCGMIISKIRPKPKYLVIWMIVAFILVVLIFSSNVFLNCTKGIYNEHQHAITIPFCSSKCNCPYGESFQPVCVDGKTFFSPCLAGCRNYSSATSVYHNCSCGSVVTQGSCDQDNCKLILALAQVNNILSNGLVSSTIIVNFLITFRSVPTKYKATALGLELTFLGIIPFIPIKIVYHFIANMFCEIHTLKGCQYFSESFPFVISVVTISFMLAAIILATILLYFVKDLKLYSNQVSNYSTTESRNIAVAVTPNRASSTSEENRAIEEDSPFIRQLGERIKSRLQRPSSREERIKTYIAEGELVPPLQKRKPPVPASTAVATSTPVVRMEPSGETEIIQEVRPNSRNNNKRHSKASGESDMSSLYRFADSIIDASDGNDSEPSIKVSQGKIVFQVAPQINTPKAKKPRHEPLILIAPDSTQPKRPAPVPHFLVETNF